MASFEKNYKNISDEREAVKLCIEDLPGDVLINRSMDSTGCCRREKVELSNGGVYIISAAWSRINKGDSRNYRCVIETKEGPKNEGHMDLFELGR